MCMYRCMYIGGVYMDVCIDVCVYVGMCVWTVCVCIDVCVYVYV
jgi:hypothetical protein